MPIGWQLRLNSRSSAAFALSQRNAIGRGLAAGALVWAALAPIRELSLASGQLIPVSQVRPVQHLEGGIVERILMEEGQVVEEDEPLMRLQTVMANSELAGLRARAQNLMLQKERVDALLAGRAADFTVFSDINRSSQIAEHQQVHRARFDHMSQGKPSVARAYCATDIRNRGLEQDIVDATKDRRDPARTTCRCGRNWRDGNASKGRSWSRRRCMSRPAGWWGPPKVKLAT